LADARRLLADLTRSDTGRAAGVGAAVIAQNVLALVFTVIFVRILGATGYGSLAVLISAYIILMVPGSALQIAVARELSGERAAGIANVGAGARRWLVRLALATVLWPWLSRCRTMPASFRRPWMSRSLNPATVSMSKPAKAVRKFSRLRKTVSQESPDWKPSSTIFS
jgi:hypothetical protein